MTLDPGRPSADEHLPYFSRYIDLVPDGGIVAQLASQLEPLLSRLAGLSQAQALHRYAPDRWSVLEVIGHLCDVERVFSFRALHLARGDASALPGFDQDVWMRGVDWNDRRLADVLAEWRAARAAALGVFEHLSAEAWSRRAVVSGHALTPRACAYIMVGHVRHHVRSLEETYGVL